MALIVQKYGGTSMGSVERIENVAEKCIADNQNLHKPSETEASCTFFKHGLRCKKYSTKNRL